MSAFEAAPHSPWCQLTSLAITASEGDHSALDGLLSSPVFRKRVRMICQRLYRDHPGFAYMDAADIEQDVMQRVIEKIHQFNAATASIQTWVSKLAYSVHVDHLRKKKRESVWQSEHRAFQERSNMEDVDLELLMALEHAFSKLGAEQQAVFLHRVNGLRAKEISDKTGLKVKQIYRMLESVQRALLQAMPCAVAVPDS